MLQERFSIQELDTPEFIIRFFAIHLAHSHVRDSLLLTLHTKHAEQILKLQEEQHDDIDMTCKTPNLI